MRHAWVLGAMGLAFAGCAAEGGYVRGDVVYAEPPVAVYETPVDRAVGICRDVLVSRGFVVFRVAPDGPSRVVWARHGDDDVVRVFVSPQGERVAVRTIHEMRDRDRRVWVRRDPPREVVADIDLRLRAH
jgi:hypothetical protein